MRRHIEGVAQQRRMLPPSRGVTRDYHFVGEGDFSGVADLFGDKEGLAVYSDVFAPERARPCPMSSSLPAAWDGEALDVSQRTSHTNRQLI